MSVSCRLADGYCHGSSSVLSRRADGAGFGLVPGGQVKRLDLPLELERAAQRVQQELADLEVACGGPDEPAGDEFECGA